MIEIIKGALSGLLLSVVELITSILPKSPFTGYMHYFSESKYLKYINYFIPVDVIITIMETWLLCVALWYAYGFLKNIVTWVSSYGGVSGGTAIK